MQAAANRACWSFVVAILYCALAASALGQATFTPLSDLPGGEFFSSATAVSADGGVVVGSSNSANGNEAFRWTAAGGRVGLGDQPGGIFSSTAFAVSADGLVVVGGSDLSYEPRGGRSFRWTAAHGMVGLHLSEEFPANYATGVSADGSVIVGQMIGLVGAIRWTANEGIVELAPGDRLAGYARGVSADGSVVVGAGVSARGTEAFRWTAAGGIAGLGTVPGGRFPSEALAVSADGSVVVGRAGVPGGEEGFRWSADTGMVRLAGSPHGVSADGSVVVGSGLFASRIQACYWTDTLGPVNLRDLLVRQGADNLDRWTLTAATAVSADGLTIAGTGINPGGATEAWVATIPEPSTVELAALAIASLPLLRYAGQRRRKQRSRASVRKVRGACPE
jgi:probable HAF family extracellular repeat protein